MTFLGHLEDPWGSEGDFCWSLWGVPGGKWVTFLDHLGVPEGQWMTFVGHLGGP